MNLNEGMPEKAASLRRAVEHGVLNGKRNMIVDLDVLDELFRGEIPVGGNQFTPNRVNELLYEVKGQMVDFRQALKAASADMHHPSDRLCETCQRATKALGEPFGCYAWQAKRKAP